MSVKISAYGLATGKIEDGGNQRRPDFLESFRLIHINWKFYQS